MEFDDKTNVHKRRQEGYELVRAEEYPEYSGPVVDEGRNAGIIGVGGLVLARIPEELADQRNQHQKTTQNQMDAVDRDWMRENNPAMPKMAPQQSSASFSSRPKMMEIKDGEFRAPFGLRPARTSISSTAKPLPNCCKLRHSIFQGDLVAMVTGGGIERVAAGGSGFILGVFNGCEFTDPTQESQDFQTTILQAQMRLTS